MSAYGADGATVTAAVLNTTVCWTSTNICVVGGISIFMYIIYIIYMHRFQAKSPLIWDFFFFKNSCLFHFIVRGMGNTYKFRNSFHSYSAMKVDSFGECME